MCVDICKIQPIPNEPALFIEGKKVLVIADLHIGIESELREQGVNTKSQTDKMFKRLTDLCKKYKPNEIVLLGDIKHNIPIATKPERRDVRDFLYEIKELATIHIIPGNHDGNIKWLAPEDMQIHNSDGFVIENVAFIHGHRWADEAVMKSDLVVMGHTHPTIMFTDRLGYKTFEPCWLRGNFLKSKIKEKYPKSKNPEIIVLPAFNPLCGGIAANKDGINGPFGKIIDIQNLQVYLLDGACLGNTKDIV